ncbi:MAG: glycosyltransferase family 2 protein, partial [Spirochaetia bacterium]|nr:glycosyltransferase family 2 protein [Spirochaetia bacterium]
MPQKSAARLPSLDLVIPCYNEGQVIRETYRRIQKTIAANRLPISQIIFINDGSSDDTITHLSAIARIDPHITVIDLSRNFGHQAAVTAGLHRADADVTVILDADLQDPPELIPEMIRIHLREKAGVVYGARKSRKGESWFKKTTARYFYKFINAMIERPFPENTGDFRLIDKNVLNAFKALPERGKYIRGL